MKLVASMIVRNELGRYLEPCIRHLLEFCDQVVILDDGSTELYDDAGRPTGEPDGQPWEMRLMGAFGEDGRRVLSAHRRDSEFFRHEGLARQRLLDLTLEQEPTHILAIDADEFVTDGRDLRAAVERAPGRYAAWNLCMQEVWNADESRLEIRQDGGWDEHDVAILWRADAIPSPRIADRQLACGRVPEALRSLRTGCGDSAILHFGWANRDERRARYERYAAHDGGRFHAGSHLASILLPDDQIELVGREWPEQLDPYRDRILAHAGVRSEG